MEIIQIDHQPVAPFPTNMDVLSLPFLLDHLCTFRIHLNINIIWQHHGEYGRNQKHDYVYIYPNSISNITFNQKGLASGTSWNVTLEGENNVSTTYTITFSGKSNGNYEYTIFTPSGYVCGSHHWNPNSFQQRKLACYFWLRFRH